jgi:hypothetical protein
MNVETKAVILKEAGLIKKRLLLIMILSACAVALTYIFYPDKLPNIVMILFWLFLFNLGVSLGIMMLANKIEKSQNKIKQTEE